MCVLHTLSSPGGAECGKDNCGQTVQENIHLDGIRRQNQKCYISRSLTHFQLVHTSTLSDQNPLKYVLLGLLDITL